MNSGGPFLAIARLVRKSNAEASRHPSGKMSHYHITDETRVRPNPSRGGYATRRIHGAQNRSGSESHLLKVTGQPVSRLLLRGAGRASKLGFQFRRFACSWIMAGGA